MKTHPPFYNFFFISFLNILLSCSASYSQSLQLTAGTQWVNLGDLDVSGNQITVEALINWQGGVNVISKHTGPNNVNYLLRPTTFEITTGTTFHLMNNPYTLQQGVWYHIAGVYNGSNIIYYVNGCPVIQQPASGNMAQQNLNTAIGNISSSPYAEQFIGMIDEVRIWNIARTQADIAANMNDLPNPTTYPNLRGYYKFNNNLLNSANASFNGIANGALSYGPEAPIIQQLSIISVVPTNVTCFGLNNGTVTINSSGSGVQYSVNGSTYQTGNSFSNLAPGNYTAYIRSAEGCILTQAFSITQPAQLASSFTATICSDQTYSFGGNSYNTSGTYQVVNPGSTGCDSTSTLQLTVIPATGNPPAASTFNTANNGLGGTLAGGATDLSWQVATGNINGTYSPAIVMNIIPGSYYNSPWPDCKWISHAANGSHSGSVEFYYRKQFELPCYNYCGQSYADDGVFCLSLDFFADNSVYEIYVNGVPQSANITGVPNANPYSYTGFSQTGMISVTLCNDWQPGTNTITIHVSSGSPYAAFLAQAAINPPTPPTDTVSAQICSGQTYTYNGTNYTTTGQYLHTFQNINGCDSLVTLDLLVNPTPAQPNITSNSPICEGATLQLNTPAVTNATYTWTGPNSWSSNAQNPTRPTATTDMSGTYSLFVQANGCTSSLSTANLEVNPIPDTPSVSIGTPICEGNILSLSSSGGTGLQYFWSGPNAWTANTQNVQIPNINTSQAGNYSLYVVLNGCTSVTVTENVVVRPKPNVTYTGPTSFCGTQVNLTVSGNVSAPASILTYQWYVPGSSNPFSTGDNINYNFSSANPSTQVNIAVLVMSTDACADTSFATITLFATPHADFESINACHSLNIIFNENATWDGNPNNGALTQYQWNFGNGNTGIGANTQNAYADTGVYSVTLIVGSTESTCQDTITKDIHVIPNPQITLTITPSTCGQTVYFEADITPKTNIQSLEWDFGDVTPFGTDSTVTHTYQQAGSYNISFTIETDYNCTYSGQDVVLVHPSPTISTIPIPNIITPNGDAVNDAITLNNLLADCVEYEMKILNRWGNLIYTQSKNSLPFSGRNLYNALVSPGVYFYIIKSGTEEKTGTLTVAY